MTELEIRQKFVKTAESYRGCNERDGSHKKIIDIYNSHKPLARGFRMPYTEPWCATYVSAMAILCGLTDIIPTEVGCPEQIKAFQRLGRWMEKDDYVPLPGDILYYDWQDKTGSKADNVGVPDHVGIVVSVVGINITIIEGNIRDSVDYRPMVVNGDCIRGYGIPDFASKATKEVKPVAPKWYETSGEWALATSNGIVDGTRPDDKATRAEVTTMIWRVFGKSEKAGEIVNPFTDVNETSWYYDAVMWMYKNGITKGKSETSFSPGAYCTRAEVAAFILRAMKLEAK